MKEMLSGMKVLDFTTNAAGPTCAAMLADYGADVIKVERPVTGDDSRHFGVQIDGQSLVHCWVNRGKKSVTLNLNSPEGVAIAKKLALNAHVICESYRPGIMEKFGLGYEALKKENPKIIYCAVSAFGLRGPYAKKPGYDMIAQAVSGLIDLIGEADGPPLKSGLVIGDYWGGLNAFGGVVTAWFHYLRTGKGQLVDASLVQNLVYLNSAVLDANVGVKTTRGGNHHKDHSPYGVFKGKGQQYAVVSVENDAEWRLLACHMGRSDLADNDERWRVEQRGLVTQALETWLAGFEAIEQALAQLQQLGIVSCKAGDMKDVAADVHIAANGWITDVALPHGVTSRPSYKARAVHAGFSLTPGSVKQAPALGQHNHEILSGLGLSTEEVRALQEKWAAASK